MVWPDICSVVYGVNLTQSFKATPKTNGNQGKDLVFAYNHGSLLNLSSCIWKTKPTTCKAEVSQQAWAS